MAELWQALKDAIHLIISRDPQVIDITWRSLRISAASTILAALICIPLGGLISFRTFRGKRFLINIIQTLYSVPTVCVGLLVYLMVSHVGPLGFLHLVFTPTAMIIAQVLLIIPVMLGLTITALSGVDKTIKDTTISLGATEFQAIWAIIKEARFAIVGAVLLGFGRAISEVGAAMIVGGNISQYTRVLTTAISLLSSEGEFALAMALGIILIAVALVVNIAVNMVQQRR